MNLSHKHKTNFLIEKIYLLFVYITLHLPLLTIPYYCNKTP